MPAISKKPNINFTKTVISDPLVLIVMAQEKAISIETYVLIGSGYRYEDRGGLESS